MSHKSITFLGLSIAIFTLSCAALVWQWLDKSDDTFRCSGDLSIYQDNVSLPLIKGRLSITFEPGGKGYIRMDGISHLQTEKAALHRFIFFDYRVGPSPFGDDYIMENYRIVRAPADASADKTFLGLVNIISLGSQKLRVRVRKLNPRTNLIGSVNSPLLVCTSY